MVSETWRRPSAGARIARGFAVALALGGVQIIAFMWACSARAWRRPDVHLAVMALGALLFITVLAFVLGTLSVLDEERMDRIFDEWWKITLERHCRSSRVEMRVSGVVPDLQGIRGSVRVEAVSEDVVYSTLSGTKRGMQRESRVRVAPVTSILASHASDRISHRVIDGVIARRILVPRIVSKVDIYRATTQEGFCLVRRTDVGPVITWHESADGVRRQMSLEFGVEVAPAELATTRAST